MPDLDKVKKAIQEFEYYEHSAGGRLAGVSVKIENVRFQGDYWYVDVIVFNGDETVKYKDVYYPEAMFKSLGENPITEQWLERWHRRASMDRFALPQQSPEGPDEGALGGDPLDPVYLKTYLENFKKIMKRQMPNVPDAQLYQDAFVQMIELLLPDSKKYEIDYLKSIVDVAAGLPTPITLTIPIDVHTQIQTRQIDTEEAAEKKKKEELEKKKGTTLEEQLAKAIAEERYEDVPALQEQIKRLNKILGRQYHGTLHRGDVQ